MGKEVVCRRFNAMGLQVEQPTLSNILKIAALLHDLGKAADCYQISGRTSYYLHELPSSVICWRLCEELRLSGENKILISLVVLQHMCTLRDWLGGWKISELRKEIWQFTRFRTEVQNFLSKNFGISVKLDVETSNIKKVLLEIKNALQNHRMKFLKLYTLLLAPLSTADNLDVYEFKKDNLDNSRKWFVEELTKLEDTSNRPSTLSLSEISILFISETYRYG
jgi:CRISPR/Cas system-associated endonuclease Cas3-HD